MLGRDGLHGGSGGSPLAVLGVEAKPSDPYDSDSY